ncbi:hypothetical protein HY637_04255 [Candidatus Woesearchaeota archaeon]|nr:hypothetical protein [Candidatus Woesearchaeota archaeon]
MDSKIPKSLRHFTKRLFLVSKVYADREKARMEVYEYLQKMRKSIIRMSLGYSDIDRLKQKIDNMARWERKYSKYFRPEDDEKQQLREHINALEEELGREREEKFRIKSEQEERIKELSDSLENVKHKMRHLLLEKAKRHHRLKALEHKIDKGVDRKSYFGS